MHSTGLHICRTPEETFALGRAIGNVLRGGEVILLIGELGAGKTLMTKGILDAAGFDAAEVTSPSFALVNIYPAEKFDVYHIDLWRLETDPVFAVGLDEILENENAAVIIEWAERLGNYRFDREVLRVSLIDSGDDAREISIERVARSASCGQTRLSEAK